jgi:hypothetical protein
MVMVAWTFSHLHAKSSAIQMKKPIYENQVILDAGYSLLPGASPNFLAYNIIGLPPLKLQP